MYLSKGLLCGATSAGRVVFWKRSKNETFEWHESSTTRLKQGILFACWGPNFLALTTSTSAYVLSEHNLSASYYNKVCAVQLSASQVTIWSEEQSCELNTDLQVSGLTLGAECLAVWSGKVMAIYQVVPIGSTNVVGSFACDCVSAGLWEQSVTVLRADGSVQVLTMQGTVKQTIEMDGGQVITLSSTGPYLALSTASGMLQLWDLTRREAKPHSKIKDLMESIPDFGEVILAQTNRTGNKVAFTLASSSLTPLPLAYVWDVEQDSLFYYDFSKEKILRFVVKLEWDFEDGKLLVCEARRPNAGLRSSSASRRPPATAVIRKHANTDTFPTTILVTFIATANHGLLVQDSFQTEDDFVSLLALDTPFYIIMAKSLTHPQSVQAKPILMKDFEGLEDCDAQTKSAVINFSISLNVNDLDQAFKSIRNIKSVAVWSSLAKMCIKGRRLDVARVCLGHMKHTRGVQALVNAQNEPEPQVQLAAVALQLSMFDEAEKLYLECSRYDLLNKMYQQSDLWEKAIEIAEKHDRIHLRNTYHNYAKYLEGNGDLDGAAQMYYKAETHRHEVPRMLLYDTPALDKYIKNSKDPLLLKWWAQYMESTGDMSEAMKFYQEAGDHLSMVRVLCYLEEYDKASLVADNTADKPACYHLARQLETMGRIQEAIHFFTRATAYANAIRICKEQGLEDQLWGLALSAGPREQLEAAKFLEPSYPDKAALLYHKAGMLHRALDLAFKNNQYDAIEMIATELTPESDKGLLVKCAEFFIEQQHFEKAVHLLAVAKQYAEGINLCWERNVMLTEELAEKLTPDSDNPNKNALLETLGDCALAQANYHLATKKYTQAGNKMKAMKALLKSGDTEKIIFFANVSRQREMYVMAANYLQSLDWQAKPDLLKTIITFYSKGKAPHLLSNFYTACAQVEIDDYGNYEKALGALNEALKCLNIKGNDQYSSLQETITRKIALVNKFLEVRRQFERGDFEGGMSGGHQLINGSLAHGEMVRVGDVYALMIEHSVKRNDLSGAKMLAQELKNSHPQDSLSFYLHQDLLNKLGIKEDPIIKPQLSEEIDEDIVPEEAGI